MSVPPTNATATPAGGRPRLTVGALLSRSLRAAVMLVLAAAGLMLVQTYHAMLHDAPASPATAPRPPRPDALPDGLPTALLGPGGWSLGDSAWGVTLTALTDSAEQTLLNSLGQAWTSQAAPSPLEGKVLAWLRSSHPTLVGGCRVYDVRHGGVRVRAVTSSQGQKERIQLAQIVWKRGGESPQLLEISPAPAARPGSDEGHLLPLPAGVGSLARRWDDSGRLSGELLGPTDRGEQCLQLWSNAGWTAHPVSAADTSFSLIELNRDGRTIHVCSVPAGDNHSSAYLLLAAQPAHNSEGNR
jgi:hypothetical protein